MWECFKAGFFDTLPPSGMSADQAREAYKVFLADIPRFKAAMVRVTREWPNSSSHWLSNDGMNRIAWLGQSAMCIDTGVPAVFRGGFKLLTERQQVEANCAAREHLEWWMKNEGDREIREDLAGERVSARHTGRRADKPNEARLGSVIQGSGIGHTSERSSLRVARNDGAAVKMVLRIKAD